MKISKTTCNFCLWESVRIFLVDADTFARDLDSHFRNHHEFSKEDIAQFSEHMFVYMLYEVSSSKVECHAPHCWLNTPVEIPNDTLEVFVRNHTNDFKHIVVVKQQNGPATYFGRDWPDYKQYRSGSHYEGE